MKRKICLSGMGVALLCSCFAADGENMKVYQDKIPWEVNYDEASMPQYILPEVLLCQDGTEVKTVVEWETKRRPELLKLFQDVMYGELPPLPDQVSYEVLSAPEKVFGSLAYRRETRIAFKMKNGRSHAVDVLLYTPADTERSPVFVGLTFGGNHVVSRDPRIHMTGLAGDRGPGFMRERGVQERRFPLETILRRGYAIAVASYHDIFPDYEDGWQNSIYKLFFTDAELLTRPKGYSSIGAWAWGLSRILDYLLTVPEIDGEKAAVYGHSRLGKTSLWAAVTDSRFKLACVNDSGCGGAALSRRLYGETLFSMYHKNSVGRWWFTDSLLKKCGSPQELPLDQHELIALVAPRAIAVHSATEDQWADPKGEYLAAYYAGKVYRLYGLEPLASVIPPEPEKPVGTDISYFLRSGKHDLLIADWEHYMDVADHIFRKNAKQK